MFWSLAPLVAACVLLAGLLGMCSFLPGTAGPAPSYDVTAALRADAQTFAFPIRQPQLPQGWQANSGGRGEISDGRTDKGQRQRAVTSTVGYLSPTGWYVRLTQSNADEDKLVASIHHDLYPSGTVDIDGTAWVVYDGDSEPVWTTRLGTAQLAITGAGSTEDFRTLAAATQSQPPLPSTRSTR